MNYRDNTNELKHHGIPGMKWGVRRYQNKDGSLTRAGQRRYERDQRENVGKKKSDKVKESDPKRWVKEDLERSKRLTDASNTMVNELKNINNNSFKRSSNKHRMDLSSMTDKEMRERINRAYLEKQYDDMFNPKKVSTGRKVVRDVLDVAGTGLTLTASALGIALAIKELKG